MCKAACQQASFLSGLDLESLLHLALLRILWPLLYQNIANILRAWPALSTGQSRAPSASQEWR
jgi:hypothetical protein